jgi:LRR receptor-like serine/threonine-protein kinase FLS2
MRDVLPALEKIKLKYKKDVERYYSSYV